MKKLIRDDQNDLVVLTTVREPVLVPMVYGYMDFGGNFLLSIERLFTLCLTIISFDVAWYIVSVDFILGVSSIDYLNQAEEQSRIRSHQLVKKYAQKLLNHFHLESADPSKQGPGKHLQVKGVVMYVKNFINRYFVFWFGRRGDPREELVRKCVELNPTCLIMGNRGLGAFKRAFIGSVCDYLVHHATCPVTIVKKQWFSFEFFNHIIIGKEF